MAKKTNKQFVAKSYKLTRNRAPLSFMLPVRHSKRFSLLHFDDKTGTNRELRYARNQKSCFVDEQDDNALLEPIIFEDGFLHVAKENQVLQEFLHYHPLNGKKFIEMDKAKDAAQEVEDLMVEADALTEANMADYQTSLVDEFTPGGIDRTNLYEDFIDNRDLVSETATSPEFNTSLINEFGVKDRGTLDANQGLQFGSIPATADEGFGLMNSDAAKAAAMSVMSNAFNQNVNPGTSDMGYPDRNMNFPDTGMLVADASKNTNQQMLENILNQDLYKENIEPFINNQEIKNQILTDPDLLKDLGITT